METSAKLLLGGVAAFGLLLLFQSKGASTTTPAQGQAAPSPLPSSGARVQVGDVVTVKLSETEPVDSETSLASIPSTTPPPMVATDLATMASLDLKASAGGAAKFKVTATGLPSLSVTNKGQPVTIGVLVDPPLSFRLPIAFLTTSVLAVERNGKAV